MAWSTQFGMLLLWPFGVLLYKYSGALGLSPWLQILLTLGVWFVFARWWLSWKPAKRYPNPFTMNQRDWQRQNQMSFFRTDHWVKRLLPTRKTSAEDLFLTQLRGHNISLPERALYWGLAVVVTVMLIGLASLFGGAKPALEMAKIQLAFSFWIYLCGGCAPFIYSCLTNLGRCWLAFPGDRTAMFRVIERRLNQSVIVDCLCLGLIGFAAHLWLDGDLFRLQWMLPVLMIALVMQWALFLIFWLVYCHSEGSINSISLVAFLVTCVQIFLIAFYWSYTDGGQTNLALPCISTFVGLTIIGLILRPRALAASEQMSFARRPN